MTTPASVKWYDRFNRLFDREFSDVSRAREFYRSLCSGNDCPIYTRLLAITTDGPIVLGEYRPS